MKNYVKAFVDTDLQGIEDRIKMECKRENVEPVSVSLTYTDKYHSPYGALVVFQEVEE